MAATVNTYPPAPYPDFFRTARAATYLTDADTTVHPDATGTSLYIVPAGTLTAARTLTMDNTGPTTTMVAQVLRLDTSAHNYVIQNSTPTTMYTTAASGFAASGIYILYQLYFTGGIWNANSIYFVTLT